MTSHETELSNADTSQTSELIDQPEHKKKNTSLRLSGSTLKALKIRAIEEDTSVQKLVENLVEAYLAGRIHLPKGTKQP